MKVYKDNEHCLTVRPFSWRGKRYLALCVGQYVALDPEGGRGRVRPEQDFWKEVPDVFAALNQAPVLDAGLPKPGAEVLLAAFCRAPGKRPVPALEAAFRVGPVERRLAVFGDRQRLPGGGFSEPLPFVSLPLTWDRAFGGPDFPANPAGRGLDGDNAPSSLAPNLEDPDHFLLSGDDRPAPACPFPLGLDNPARRALSGTYDKAWLETRWPDLPDDLNPEFFYSAQPAQRLAGRGPADAPLFFRGDEEVEILGMSHEHPHIRSRLPEVRIRAFVTTAERFVPFAPARTAATRTEKEEKAPLPYAKDLDQPGLFQEVELRLDTVWLLPDLLGAFTLRRGLLPVEDDEMDDILRVYVATEDPRDPPHSLEYHLEKQKKRLRPALEIDLAPLAAARDKTAKLVKKARDLPKILAKTKRDLLGQSPSLPGSLGDFVHSAEKTFATVRTTLDKLEKQVLAQREQFSHLMSFGRLLEIFPRIRAELDAQEKNLELALRQTRDALEKMSAFVKQDLGQNFADGPGAAAQAGAMPGAARAKLQRLLAALDSLTPDGQPCMPEAVNPWHDRGVSLLLAARRALRRADALLAGLAALGFELETLEAIPLGLRGEALEEAPENWGLEPGPAFVIPAGLYVPRFAGKALVALRVYPALPAGDGGQSRLRGLGAENADIFLAPGSDPAPLSLPASHPDGAVCVAPEDLSALFAEQEAGDFCHIAAAAGPAELGKIKDLPPLLPDVPAEEGGLPLLLILPHGESGERLFAPWRAAYPEAIPVYLPDRCPHVLALAARGHRLRRLLLDALPPRLAAVHDFDFPLPPKDGPPAPFTLNLPLPGKEEIQGGIAQLMQEVTAHYLGVPGQGAGLSARGLLLENARRAGLPGESLDKMEAAVADALKALPAGLPSAPPKAPSVAETLSLVEEKLAGMKDSMLALAPPDSREKLLHSFAALDQIPAEAGKILAPLDNLPEKIRAAFAAKGMDPDALKKPSREEVEAMLAAGESLKNKNLQGLDLSGLDFSGADLSHAVCVKTNFAGCRLDGATFTFTVANEADFSRASLRGAFFKQTALQKAALREADFTAAQLELVTLGDCEAAGAVFDRAEIKLCNFSKTALEGARFDQT
ncbi:MAG: DUF2169 domain-containing protein, partial [Desulfovibrio sp.]|nr:DUF2169 domain-containing protein [Desulfovibrio sp.]